MKMLKNKFEKIVTVHFIAALLDIWCYILVIDSDIKECQLILTYRTLG
jgi:hypothetical protein